MLKENDIDLKEQVNTLFTEAGNEALVGTDKIGALTYAVMALVAELRRTNLILHEVEIDAYNRGKE